jgi:DnaK suppressor protein
VARKKETSRAARSQKRSAKAGTRKKKVRRAATAEAAGKARKKSTARAGQAGRRRREQPRLTKSPLSKKELEEFGEMLLAKRRELLGDMTGMEEQAARQQSSGNLSRMPTHMADVGTDNFEHEFTLGLLESEQQMLREIDEAIRRIEDKTYGICVGTGQPIPKPRLQAKPWAKYTVEYTRMVEKGLVKPAEPEAEEDEELDEDQGQGQEEEQTSPEEEQVLEGQSDLYKDEQQEEA